MVPLWFLPFAVASGNTFILKPSEQVPLSQKRMFELLEKCDLPPGVVNLVQRRHAKSSRRSATTRASAPCRSSARRRSRGSSISARTHAGKRVQALGGAKNFIVVMPDADFDRSIPVITESFYGCAGERCLAGSVLLPVGEAHKPTRERLVEAARALKVGDGLEPGVTMGPVISAHASRARARLRREGHQRRREARARRPQRTRCRIGRTASSSGRRCSTTCRRRWRSATRRSSDRSPRFTP